jgi:hypothetical protein
VGKRHGRTAAERSSAQPNAHRIFDLESRRPFPGCPFGPVPPHAPALVRSSPMASPLATPGRLRFPGRGLDALFPRADGLFETRRQPLNLVEEVPALRFDRVGVDAQPAHRGLRSRLSAASRRTSSPTNSGLPSVPPLTAATRRGGGGGRRNRPGVRCGAMVPGTSPSRGPQARHPPHAGRRDGPDPGPPGAPAGSRWRFEAGGHGGARSSSPSGRRRRSRHPRGRARPDRTSGSWTLPGPSPPPSGFGVTLHEP